MQSENIHPSIARILASPNIAQRTKEWFEYRRSRVTASEVSTVLAQGRGATSLMIAKKASSMIGGGVSNEYTRIGSENETEVVRLYNVLYPDVKVYHDLPVVPHQQFNFVAASLDACTNTGINVEIKTIFKDGHVKVCKAHRAQVQLQMEVADLETTHLVHHYYRMEGKPIVVHTIPRDREWFKQSLPIIEAFIKRLQAYFPFDMRIVLLQMSKPETPRFDMTRVNKQMLSFTSRKRCLFSFSSPPENLTHTRSSSAAR